MKAVHCKKARFSDVKYYKTKVTIHGFVALDGNVVAVFSKFAPEGIDAHLHHAPISEFTLEKSTL